MSSNFQLMCYQVDIEMVNAFIDNSDMFRNCERFQIPRTVLPSCSFFYLQIPA